MTQLSWQPPVVTKCCECPKRQKVSSVNTCNGFEKGTRNHNFKKRVFNLNWQGLTKSCPMWIEQNKETPNANT